jgi:hypothetical protein
MNTMNLRIDNEWLRWGDKATDFVGFFAPLDEAYEANECIVVKNKYGEYHVNPDTQNVVTLNGVDYDVLVEVAKYGMGYKFWESEKK